MMSKNSPVTSYKKGGNLLNPFIKLSIFLIILGLFVTPVSAFDDSVQRYIVDINEVWNITVTGLGDSDVVVNYPTTYPTAAAIKMCLTGAGVGTVTASSINTMESDYVSFTVLGGVGYYGSGYDTKLRYYNDSQVKILDVSLADVLGIGVNTPYPTGRYEFVRSTNDIMLYIDGVYIDNLGSIPILTDDIYFELYVKYGNAPAINYLLIDDISTTSIIGMSLEWSQANTNIDTSYGIQSQSSFPTDEYTLKVVRPSTSETINTTSLGTGTTGNESGFVRWNRNDIFGSNFGLYQALLYRESNLLDSTTFSIFDTTIQGAVDWQYDLYTIADSPAIQYTVTNGDFSVYSYSLKIVDSNAQLKDSFVISQTTGYKYPNIASYTTGGYFAILSRTHKTTGAIDDFAYDTVIITAEGYTPSSYINFLADQYTLGDTATYNWNWNEDDTSIYHRERIVIEKDGVVLDRINTGDTGIRFLDMDELGSYRISLISYGLLTYSNPITYATDTVNSIERIDSYINVPQEAALKTNFTATYLYGSTPTTPVINIKQLQNDYTYKIIDTKILPSATAGVTYTTDISISSVGSYVIDLYDNGKGESLATDTIFINYVYIPPSDIVLSSYIDTTMTNYSYGGVISGSYAIDDVNYTDYHTKVEVYNVDKDIISFAYEPLHQIDSFDIPISDFDIYSDGDTSYPVDTNFLSGNNRVQLSAYNADGTLNEVIAHKNITISATDEEGYGLTLSKYTVEENEIFAIKAITPVQASIVIHPLTLMGVSDTTILINGTTQMSYALGIEDTYSISLVSSGETKATQIIKVLEGEEIQPPVDDDVTPTQGTIEMVIMFLSMPAFWGMIIWVGVVGGAAQSNAVNRSSTGYIAFALGNILAVVGMFAPYTMYVLVILWIGAGVFFKLGREAAGSEEY